MASETRVPLIGLTASSLPDPPQALGSILLPLMVIFYAIVEVSSRSIEGATAAASAMSGGKEFDGVGACAFIGLGLAKVWEAAGDIWDTAFVLGAVWYMLRFFRYVKPPGGAHCINPSY